MLRPSFPATIRVCAAALVLVSLLSGQTNQTQEVAEPFAGHLGLWDRLWISGQINSITQFHPAFRATYSGANSSISSQEWASSRVLTLFTGFQVTNSTEILFNVESAGGSGISDALGMAG